MPIWQQPHQPVIPNWVGDKIASILPPVANLQAIAYLVASIDQLITPVSDTSNPGSWLQDDGVTSTLLYSRINENPANDLNFDESPLQPKLSQYTARLGTVLQPIAGTITLRTRASVDNISGTVDYIVSLKQGATTIQSFTHNALTLGWVQFDDVVTNSISDWATPFDVLVQMNQSG